MYVGILLADPMVRNETRRILYIEESGTTIYDDRGCSVRGAQYKAEGLVRAHALGIDQITVDVICHRAPAFHYFFYGLEVIMVVGAWEKKIRREKKKTSSASGRPGRDFAWAFL